MLRRQWQRIEDEEGEGGQQFKFLIFKINEYSNLSFFFLFSQLPIVIKETIFTFDEFEFQKIFFLQGISPQHFLHE